MKTVLTKWGLGKWAETWLHGVLDFQHLLECYLWFLQNDGSSRDSEEVTE